MSAALRPRLRFPLASGTVIVLTDETYPTSALAGTVTNDPSLSATKQDRQLYDQRVQMSCTCKQSRQAAVESTLYDESTSCPES